MAGLYCCQRCGKTFQTNGYLTVCVDCKEKDDMDYDKIRTYLFQHPRAKIFEVSNQLDMPVRMIKRFLREGRLEIVEKNNLFLRCEECGCSIQSGRFCDDCSREHKHNYKVSYLSDYAAKRETRINFLSQDNKKIASR